MSKVEFYSGTKILSMLDANGNRPEIYMVVSNRSGGKTTFFGRMLVNRFKKKGEKFILLYRYKYELDDIKTKFFNDISKLFFKRDIMTQKPILKDSIIELFINKKSCGYAICLNSADAVKKYSHIFSDVTSILFDEFQSETSNYCANELRKFQSIHSSVARGNGEQSRYVPVYMLSNPVTIINPYYVAFGIHTRIDSKTKYLRGNGFVLERVVIESAKKAQQESTFNKAFGDSEYNKYSSSGTELLDNYSFVVGNMDTNSRSTYVATLKYNDNTYSIKEFKNEGIVYVDDSTDDTFPRRISVTNSDHEINYIMLKTNDLFISTMRQYYALGIVRFKNLMCQECFLQLVAMRF